MIAVAGEAPQTGLLPAPLPATEPPTVEQLQAQLAAMTKERDSFKFMFNDAVSSLSAVDEALGIPAIEAGGAAPILAAIQRLMFAAGATRPRDFIVDEAVVAASVARVEALRDAVAERLGPSAYDCTRVWSAWGVGTMSADDFAPIADSEDRVAEIADAIDAFPTFQARVLPWLLDCFGALIARHKTERNHRFLEEALELVQAAGCTAADAHQLVDYVYGRPVGELRQEVGGVMVTLAALCLAHDLDMHDAGEIELARIWTKISQIRAKQAAKPRNSPLPQ
nr:hypothetical protein [Cupriavidus pauculus]